MDRQYLLPAQSGQVRWNGNTKEFEVCDNQSGNWYRINPEIELGCDSELADVIQWAKRKMVEEKKLGWDITQILFKDIAHNFLGDDIRTKELINYIFTKEEEYLNRTGYSDCVFGIYQLD